MYKLFSALALSLLLVSCDERDSSQKAAAEGILLVGNNQEPLSLDPHKATSVADGKIITALLEGLVRPDAEEAARVHPGAAESWEHNDAADEWTFHLRQDGVWSDGKPVTAQDFAYAFRRMLHPQFAGKYAEMLYPLRNAEAYNRGECPWEDVGVSTPDCHTLRLTLNGPTPHLLQLLLHFTWCPVPAHAVEAAGGMLDRRSLWTRQKNWVGNGAYVLAGHRHNDYLAVSANPRYWRAAEVRNKGVRFLPIVNGYTETRMFLDGKLHITNNVPPELISVARTRAPEAYCQDPYYCTIFYRLNTTRPPLNDVRVRRALSLAVDRDALVQKVVRGAGRAAFGFTPGGAGYAAVRRAEEHLSRAEQVQEAQRLLAEAGYPAGKGFPMLELMTTSRDVQRVMAETVQAMWKEMLGIHVEIRSCEWTAYKAAQQNMDYDISSSSWSGDYLDPATFIELWRSGGGNNCTGWGNAACDAALEAARTAVSAETRREHLRRAEENMLSEQPIIPLYWSERTYLKSPAVSGWHPLILDNHPLDAVRVSTSPRKQTP
ncbi:MAG: peptide ABC transporter substrate-binding protein [Akkermansia sp.]|nr:peptide ABC transporter substrate-binding protein [Akkermansia sp.]